MYKQYSEVMIIFPGTMHRFCCASVLDGERQWTPALFKMRPTYIIILNASSRTTAHDSARCFQVIFNINTTIRARTLKSQNLGRMRTSTILSVICIKIFLMNLWEVFRFYLHFTFVLLSRNIIAKYFLKPGRIILYFSLTYRCVKR